MPAYNIISEVDADEKVIVTVLGIAVSFSSYGTSKFLATFSLLVAGCRQTFNRFSPGPPLCVESVPYLWTPSVTIFVFI